jgi:coatomer protein complex subunit gamma
MLIFPQVRDRATLYLNTLGGDGSVVETDKDVKDFLFGSLDLPLVNFETSLKNYVCVDQLFFAFVFERQSPNVFNWIQEPSEEPFDINSVPMEIKSQPLAEKKAPGKKPTGLGAPPTAPASTVDAYEKLLSAIPEFADFGKLFKVL